MAVNNGCGATGKEPMLWRRIDVPNTEHEEIWGLDGRKRQRDLKGWSRDGALVEVWRVSAVSRLPWADTLIPDDVCKA